MALSFSEKSEAEFQKIREEYPDAQAALMPALYVAQREFGHLSNDVLAYLAERLELSPARVYGVATFYTMYNKRQVGKYLIQVCTNISCALLGGEQVYQYLSKKLGIKDGGMTPDGRFSLMRVECLGACGNAPAMQINDKYYENLTKEKVDQILSTLE